MGLRSIIAAAAIVKLVLDTRRKNQQIPPSSRETFSGKGDSRSKPENRSPDRHVPDNRMSDSSVNFPTKGKTLRLHPAPQDSSIPDNFTPYEGADMTSKQAHEAGIEFEGCDKYHGVDELLRHEDICRLTGRDIPAIGWKQYARKGVPGCVITGWQGSDEIVRVPRSINGRSVLCINAFAFYKKENIREVYLPDTVMDIGKAAFKGCKGLKYARLSANLARIGESAFDDCIALERVYLGSVRDIGKRAFEGCRSLTQIRLPDRVDNIGDMAFVSTGITGFYAGFVGHAGSRVCGSTPYWDRYKYIVLGDTLQKCSFRSDGSLIIDDPALRFIGEKAFFKARAEKVTLSENIRFIRGYAFQWADIKEIYAPGASHFGHHCFNEKQRITVSGEVEFVTPTMAAKGYLDIQPDSFEGTHMEEHFLCKGANGSLHVVMVRNILTHAQYCPPDFSAPPADDLLTFADNGNTLVMGSGIEYSLCRFIPCAGAKKLAVNGMLFSWKSVKHFTELEFYKMNIAVREKSDYRPEKTVTMRYKFTDSIGRKINSTVLLYVPGCPHSSEEAKGLYELYNSCLKSTFDFNLYDREILSRISSWHVKFTAARMRLAGGFYLTDEARERYLQLFKIHRKKAEFIAKKHNDSELLDLLKSLEAININNEPEYRRF